MNRPAGSHEILEKLIKDFENNLITALDVANRSNAPGTARGNGHLELNIEAELEHGKWHLHSDVSGQIRDGLAKLRASEANWQYGRAYCYHCESSMCAHSKSPRGAAVFNGYGSSGKPLWIDFVQQLLDTDNKNTYLLYEKNPPLLTTMFTGESLKKAQLKFFGKDSKLYNVLGQVSVGYFTYQSKRIAMSIQIVEHINAMGKTVLDVNLLSHSDLRAFLLQRSCEQVFLSIKRLENTVDNLSKQLNKINRRLLKNKVHKALKKLCHDLERSHQRKKNRSNHAKIRYQQKRPISLAVQDARSADLQKFFYDSEADTVIVLGSRGRVHIFSSEGVHVTSLVLDKNAINRRLRQQRWVPATAAVRAKILNALSQKKLA